MRRALPTSFLLLCCLASTALADPSTKGKWERINRKDGITVYSKEVPGSDLVAVKGVTTIKQPLEKVLSVLMTHQRWDEWVDSMSESRILKTFHKYDYIIYQAFEMPVLVSDRDFVYRGTVTRDEQGRVILSMSSCKWKSAPETVGVRAELTHSQYVLTPKSKTQTGVEVEIHADPKGMIPDWIVNSMQKSWPINTLGGVREQAKRKDIKPVAPPPMKKATKAKAKAKPKAQPDTAKAKAKAKAP